MLIDASMSQLGEYDEGLQVAYDKAGEQHKAKLAPRCLDYRRVDVLKESSYDAARGGNA